MYFICKPFECETCYLLTSTSFSTHILRIRASSYLTTVPLSYLWKLIIIFEYYLISRLYYISLVVPKMSFRVLFPYPCPFKVYSLHRDFFFFFLNDCTTTCGNSWSRDWIWAMAATYTTAAAMLGPLTHCAGLGIEPVTTTWAAAVGFLTYCPTTGTPHWTFMSLFESKIIQGSPLPWSLFLKRLD